jgi:hypothetical protein
MRQTAYGHDLHKIPVFCRTRRNYAREEKGNDANDGTCAHLTYNNVNILYEWTEAET